MIWVAFINSCLVTWVGIYHFDAQPQFRYKALAVGMALVGVIGMIFSNAVRGV
jgi:hypothetical protein